jgi:hypothetical protein
MYSGINARIFSPNLAFKHIANLKLAILELWLLKVGKVLLIIRADVLNEYSLLCTLVGLHKEKEILVAKRVDTIDKMKTSKISSRLI